MKATPLLDLFAVSDLWTEEQRMVRDAVRTWSRREFLPLVADAYLEETFPDHLVPGIAALGTKIDHPIRLGDDVQIVLDYDH